MTGREPPDPSPASRDPSASCLLRLPQGCGDDAHAAIGRTDAVDKALSAGLATSRARTTPELGTAGIHGQSRLP